MHYFDSQEMAKETITKITNEKLSAIQKMDDLVKQLGASEDEQAVLKELYEKCNKENQRLAEEVAKVATQLEEAKEAAAANASSAEVPSDAHNASLVESADGSMAQEDPKQEEGVRNNFVVAVSDWARV